MSDEKTKPLPPRRRMFVLEYLKDQNATNAAIRAGYSASSATQTASELMTFPEVRDAIATGLQRLALKVETKAEDVLRALKELSEYDPADAYGEDGKLLDIHEMPPEVRKALVAIETEELYGIGMDESGEPIKMPIGKVRKAKFVSREKALEMLAKFHKLLIDRVEHSADSSFAEALKAARERAKPK